jgi:hypothetical protein
MALEALAGALGRDEWVTVLTARGLGHTPRLHVINRRLPALASDVYAEAGWYWWPHAERIARTGNLGQAAAAVAYVLGTDAMNTPNATARNCEPPTVAADTAAGRDELAGALATVSGGGHG